MILVFQRVKVKMRIEQSDIIALNLFDEYKKIDNDMILVIQRSGFGKSLAIESIVEELHNLGYIIIFASDVKNIFENCYAMFEPKEKYHLDSLKKEGKTPSKKKVKIYHPFCFNIPSKKKLPEINFFTIPIKSLNREMLCFIGETDLETDSIRLLNSGIRSLSDKDNIYDLIHHIRRKAKTHKKKYYGKDITQVDKSGFLIDVSQKGTATNVSEIASWFEPFINEYFLTPKNFKLNLNIKNILNDREHYHCLTTKYIKDEKMKYFVIFSFLNEIMSNLEDEAKYPVCFVFEEVGKLFPFRGEGFKKYLANYARDKLMTIRSVGRGSMIVMSSQVWFDIDEKIREKGNEIFIGNVGGLSDIDRIAKALNYSSNERHTLSSLPKNTYLRKGYEDRGAFRFFMPSHCHAEPKYNFIEMYSRHYHEKMKDYSGLIKEVRQHLKSIQDNYKESVKADQKQKIAQAKEDYEKSQFKLKKEKELDVLKERLKMKDQLSREEKIKMVAELKENNPDIGIRKIAETLHISKSLVSIYLKIIEDRKKLPKMAGADISNPKEYD